MRTGPVIIGFDGAPASVRAVREAGVLFAPRTALVAYVWEAGRTFEGLTLPEHQLEAPGTLDLDTAFASERAASEEAQQLAEQGATLARTAGLQADALAVPNEVSVADTLIKLAHSHGAQAVVVGAHERHRLAKLAPSRTLAALLHAAPCPVVVCGVPAPAD